MRIESGRDRAFLNYFVAFAGVVIVYAMSGVAHPILQDRAQFLPFVLPVLVAAYSGAHINPAVTIALAAGGKFPWESVPGYVIAQMIQPAGAVFPPARRCAGDS